VNEPREDADHLITLYGPKELGCVSHGDRVFEVFEGGEIDVPPELVETLLAHGFTRNPAEELKTAAEEDEAAAEAAAEAAEQARKDDQAKADALAAADKIAAAKAAEAAATPIATAKGAKNAPDAGA
jgi:regulator of protease activity HflC (stomatin/prohibitin superfamily)